MSLHVPTHPVRFVTAASLFDGHDAAINVMRRILQSQGAEVVHLGHDRSVDAVVTAAVQEDVQGVALSSYQGGHVEYFTYLKERLAEVGAGHVQVFGGGGGVIVADEIALLAERGVKIFAPEDGQRLGPRRHDQRADRVVRRRPGRDRTAGRAGARRRPGGAGPCDHGARGRPRRRARRGGAARPPQQRQAPVLGITGTGGSGKSSLTDELVRRFRLDQEDKLRIAVLAVDPTRRKGGGALLGDRIRMNAIDDRDPSQVFFRSLATRRADGQLPEHLGDVIAACRAAGYDLVVVETPGIGQGDAAIVPFCDVSLYVMTPEYGAASQLEKIDMLDFADVVAVNKYERRGAEDARRDVARQLVRNREAFGASWQDMPVYGTSAARFDDDGVTALYQELRDALGGKGLALSAGMLPRVDVRASTGLTSVLPPSSVTYLGDVAAAVRTHHEQTARQADGRPHRPAPADRPRPPRRGRRRHAGRRDRRRRGPARHLDQGRSGRLAGDGRAVRRRRARLRRARSGVPHAAAPRVAVGHAGAARRAAAHDGRRRPRAVPARGGPARLVPVHRGRVPVQADGGGAGADVRR